ncbi:hypothetical protein C8J57DRAFT_1229201 [Mycena rebaudengoi]|nr:hypothetical protein C8J57DRAFT_1229201 [Mycena rebaudengoi]
MDEHTAANLTVPLVSPTHSLRIARLMTTFVDCLGKMLNAPSVTAIAVDEQEFISETDFKGSCSAFVRRCLGRAPVEAKFCDIIEGSPRKWDENTAKSAKNMAWMSSSEEWGAGWPLCIEGAVLAHTVVIDAWAALGVEEASVQGPAIIHDVIK